MGRAALAAVFNVWIRRLLGVCFIIYGVLLGLSSAPTPSAAP
jgi:homoserine/homoserine lactone efflux protein